MADKYLNESSLKYFYSKLKSQLVEQVKKDLPTIPTKTSDLKNDSEFATMNDIPGFVDIYLDTKDFVKMNDLEGFLDIYMQGKKYVTMSEVQSYVDSIVGNIETSLSEV